MAMRPGPGRWPVAGRGGTHADATPDGGKAYAVSRLLKGVATGYDLVYDGLSEAERTEIRDMLAATARNYYAHYFNTPERTAPGTRSTRITLSWSSVRLA